MCSCRAVATISVCHWWCFVAANGAMLLVLRLDDGGGGFAISGMFQGAKF